MRPYLMASVNPEIIMQRYRDVIKGGFDNINAQIALTSTGQAGQAGSIQNPPPA